MPYIDSMRFGVANPQLKYFDNFQGKDIVAFNRSISANTVSFQQFALPVSMSWSNAAIMISGDAHNRTFTFQLGIYSMTGGTLSLENSASLSRSHSAGAFEWLSFTTSAAQNLSPGQWYFGLNWLSAGNNAVSIGMNSSANPGNTPPFFIKGHMTVSTNALPASVATSDLDITGADAVRQPYIVLSAA